MGIPENIIERLVGSPVLSQRRFVGGDISGASEIVLEDGRVMVGKHGPVVDVEARMLEAMGRSVAPVPKVLGHANNVLLIERLASGGSLTGDAWRSLADALSGLHAITGTDYGWPEDYALRHVQVENAQLDHWPRFWAERRLLCHVAHLAPDLARRVECLGARIEDILPASPPPVLLHGDLWGGNVLVANGRVTGLIDPCTYFGDREVDFASLTVFDSPPPGFFEAVEPAPGWRERIPVYRLWMWLLHVRLFSDGYRPAVERDLAALGF